MTVTSKVLLQGKLLESSQVTQYTSTNAKTIIGMATLVNTSAGIETVTINVVAAADSAAAKNIVHKTLSLAAGETKLITALIGLRLDAGDFISTIASTGAAIAMRLDGRQIT